MPDMWSLFQGDCHEILKTMPDASVDAIVTDPPYGLSFMGKHWDYDVPSIKVWAECLRVLKPGGHLLAFAGTRTQHRMAVRIEDAGFEIRDMIAWVYGSGFPKSRNFGGDWQGWGTALKPALEPITVARKPLTGTVAENVLTHGTGALNIDGCRVEPTGESRERVGEASQERRYTDNGGTNFAATPGIRGGDPTGRWPANLIHDGSDEAVAGFPHSKSCNSPSSAKPEGKILGGARSQGSIYPGENGSAARFFYCAKASKADRAGSNHPTVKPIALMQYLVRLVTPPGGTVLDPFAGSGTTLQAAVEEGFKAIGIEREQQYCDDIRRRMERQAQMNAANGTQLQMWDD